MARCPRGGDRKKKNTPASCVWRRMDRKALKRDGGIRNYNAPTVINDIFLNPGSSHIRNKQSATEIIIMMYSF